MDQGLMPLVTAPIKTWDKKVRHVVQMLQLYADLKNFQKHRLGNTTLKMETVKDRRHSLEYYNAHFCSKYCIIR